MATIDSLQDSVNTLTSSTTALLDEVNVSKATLTNSKDLAEAAATSATTQAANAASSASAASSSASSASASASAASASAASASAIVTGVATGMPSVRPSLNLDFVNSKTVDPRISFTRSTTATYYDGKTTAKAEENLVIDSEAFGGWAKAYLTTTSNTTTAPNGTTTADTLTANAGTSVFPRVYPYSLNGIANVNYVASVYAKAGTHNFLQIYTAGQAAGCNFDLSTGTMGTPVAPATASMTDVGNGWYRCSISYTISSTDKRPVFVLTESLTTGITSNGAWNPVGTETIYLWGAQVEQRDSLTAYTPTTTSPITNYIPVLQTAAINEPRLDHDPVTGEAKGLLIEESRTNTLTYSEDFSNAIWYNYTGGLLANATTAPNGALTAMKLQSQNSTDRHHVMQQIANAGNGSAYTFSTFVKPAGWNFAAIQITDRTNVWCGACFDMVNGTWGEQGEFNAAITNKTAEQVGNGWWKLSISWTSSVFDATSYADIEALPTGNFIDISYYRNLHVGNGFDGIYIWGAQVEAGSFPTSYIPTSGASVSRTSDRAYMTDVSWVSPYKGTFICEAASVSAPTGNASSYFEINNGTSTSRINAYDNITDTTTYYEFRVDGVNMISPSLSNTGDKIAFSYDTTSISIAQSGATYSNATVDGGYRGFAPTQLLIGDIYNGQSYKTNGTIKNLKYYPENLSASEIAVATDA